MLSEQHLTTYKIDPGLWLISLVLEDCDCFTVATTIRHTTSCRITTLSCDHIARSPNWCLRPKQHTTWVFSTSRLHTSYKRTLWLRELQGVSSTSPLQIPTLQGVTTRATSSQQFFTRDASEEPTSPRTGICRRFFLWINLHQLREAWKREDTRSFYEHKGSKDKCRSQHSLYSRPRHLHPLYEVCP